MASIILSNIPVHTTYCEAFVGGGAVFWKKEKSKVEVINDLNNSVSNFYAVAKTQFAELQTLIQSTLHSRKAHIDASVIYHAPHLFSKLQQAWAFFTLCNQSYSSNIESTWGFNKTQPALSKSLANRRDNFTEEYTDRLREVSIECDDALKVVKHFDYKEAFFYLDPPYFNSDCGHYEGYQESDFKNLLEVCSNLKGKFLLSSYPSEILQSFVEKNNWYQVKVEKMLCTSSNQSQRRKIEVLTANYPISL